MAHALKSLPEIAATFSTGELSYSKVRAMTRVANKENEPSLVGFALRHTATQVEERCRELRWGNESSIDCAARAYANRSLRIRRDPQRGMMIVTAELTFEAGELLEKALDKAVVVTEDEDGEPLSIGRKTRLVPTAIQRALRARDNNCCTFPGCNNRRFLHSHHVEHWSSGGETSLDNLMLLCTKHHTLVHEGGFRIEKDFTDSWYFLRPDGIAVPGCGYHERDFSDTYEIPPAGGLLSMAERTVSEPSAPAYLH